jgi:hypothetical protein
MVRQIGKLQRCAVRGCQAAVNNMVEIELPATWTADEAALALVATVPVGACRWHAVELSRRLRGLYAARRDLHSALEVIELAVATESALRADLAAAQERALQAQADLAEAERTAALPRAVAR